MYDLGHFKGSIFVTEAVEEYLEGKLLLFNVNIPNTLVQTTWKDASSSIETFPR